MRINSYLKNTMMLLMELAIKSKKINSDECDYEKKKWNLNLILMIIYH